MEGRYNMRSPAVKRLMKEAQELREPTEQYFAQPLEDNLFEWHFTIRGPSDSEFEGGIYHGRIILPPDYPMKPPSIMLLTPNGRFEIFKKICLSISGHHPESWQPSWSIRTALLAIIGFMPTHGSGAIGSLDYTPEERKVLAKKSQDWKCQSCGNVNNILKVVTEASEKTKQEAKELASQINFQGEKEKKEESGPVPNSESGASAGAPSDAAPAPEGASSTSTPPPATPPMFPWPMPGMPPFPVPPGGNQQFRFPFPPSPFMIPPEWNQQMPPRYPPFFMHPGFPGAPSPMTGTSQMPSMMSRFPTMKMGLTNTTSSSNRPVMSERQSANKPESQTKNKQSQSSSESKSASNSTSEEPATPSPTATSMPSSSESKTTSSSTTTTSSTSHSQSEGLRQRQTSRPTSTPQQAQVPSPAPVFNQQQDQPSPGGIMSSGLMLVIGLIILLLLVRRLYMMDFLH